MLLSKSVFETFQPYNKIVFNQPESRHLKFWISPIEGSQEFSIKAHEIGKTAFNVPPLDRQWLMSFTYLSGIVLSHIAGPVDIILDVQYSLLHAK